MIWEAIKKLLPGASALSTVAMWGSILGMVSGALLWGYNAVKEQGAAELRAQQLEADYRALEESAANSIKSLAEQYSRDKQAAASRQRAGEQIAADLAADNNALQKDLDDARKAGDKCLDTPLPPARAERLRQLAREAAKP